MKNISKLISLVLRHEPQYIGLTLDEQGWANVDELITKINQKGIALDRNTLQTIVDTNDKKRFAFNENKTLIRASQGHSLKVDLQLPAAEPPDVLYHGTTAEYVKHILISGIQKQKRHHVHLSENIDTAGSVGSRHGKPVILEVNAKAMIEAGFVFYLSENGVWLADEVPASFLKIVS